MPPEPPNQPLAVAMTGSQHVYVVGPRKDKRGVNLISDALPFGRLWYGEPNAIRIPIGTESSAAARPGLRGLPWRGVHSLARLNPPTASPTP